MGVDSFPRVSKLAPKIAGIDQSSGDGAKPAESATVGNRRGLVRYSIRRSENSQTHRQGKKGLGKRRVNNRQCVLKQDDPKAADNSLQDNQQQRRDSQPAQPRRRSWARMPRSTQSSANPRLRQLSDGYVRKDIANHFGPWVKNML